MASFLDTTDHTSEFEAEDIAQNRAMGILAYIGLLVLVPIFAAKGSKWARWHANRGLILLILAVAIGVASAILALLGLIPYVGIVFRILQWIVNVVAYLGLTGLMVFGIVTAAMGKAKDFPLIGGLIAKIQILK